MGDNIVHELDEATKRALEERGMFGPSMSMGEPNKDMTRRVQAVEDRMDDLRTDIRSVQSEIAAVNTRIDRINKNMLDIRTDIAQLASLFEKTWGEEKQSILVGLN